MKRLIAACALALATLPALAADLQARQGRTAPPIPGTGMMAGYLTLVNDGDTGVTVRGATSPAFGRIELHRSIEQDGQSRMEPVETLEVGAGERVVFEPGGLHLMMFEPGGEPSVGDTLPLELQTSAGPIALELHVIERAELLTP